MISSKDFIKEYNLKNKTTSNMKIQQVLSSLRLNDIGIYLRDGPFKSDIGIVNLHSTKGTHCVCQINENYFGIYGCAPPNELSKFILKGNGHCLNSEIKIQGLKIKGDPYCPAYCLYIIYLTKVIGIEFKFAVLNLYYQKIS